MSVFDDAVDTLDDQDQKQQTQPQEPANPYLETIDSLDSSRARALRTATVQAADKAPDRAAEVAKLSQSTGLSPDVVERNYDDLAKRVKVDETPYQKMLTETPHLAEWASDPNNQAVAKDDMEQLGLLEWIVTAPQRAFAQSVHQMRAAKLSTESLYRDLTTEERDQLNSEKYNADLGGALGAGKSWFRGAVTGTSQFLANVLMGLQSSAPQIAIGAGVGATIGAIAGEGYGAVPGAKFGAEVGGLLGGAQFTFQLEAGMAYDEYQGFKDEHGKPLDPAVAKAAAIATGAINAGLEVGGLEIVLKTIPGLEKLGTLGVRNAVKQALRNPTVREALGKAVLDYGKALTAETSVEVAQRATTILAGEIGKYASGTGGPLRTPSDVLADLEREGAGALQSFAFGVAVGPAFGIGVNARRAQRATQAEAFFKALGEGVAQSKTIERMPEAAQQFLEKATAGGPVETVYAPADTFRNYWQEQGLDPAEVARELTGRSDALEMAENTGTDLAIPTAAYAVKLAGTEHHQFFVDELRLGPDEMNAREAKAFQEEIKAQKAAEQEAERTPEEQVRLEVQQSLEGAGVPAETAAHYSALYEGAFGALAERAGVNAKDLYAQYGLKVERPDLAAPLEAGEAVTPPPPPETAAEDGRAAAAPAAAPTTEATARVEDLFGPGVFAGPERRTTEGESPTGQERRGVPGRQATADQQLDVSDPVAASTIMMREDPRIMKKAAELQARSRHSRKQAPPRAPVVDKNVTAGETNANEPAAAPRGQELPGRPSEPVAPTSERDAVRPGAGARATEGAALAIPPSAREHFDSLYQDAISRGYTGTADDLAAAYLEARDKAETIAADLEQLEQSTDYRNLLTKISKAGGISFEAEAAGAGELEWFADALAKPGKDRIIKKSGRNRIARQGQRMPFTSAGIEGAPGIIKAKGGLSFDGMREALAQDPEFAHFADVNDFLRAFEDAVLANRAADAGTKISTIASVDGVLEGLLQVKPGVDWWHETANLLDPHDLLDMDIEGPANAADTSFNVEEFGQGLFDQDPELQRKEALEALATDEGLGVTYELDGASMLPDGSYAVVCTNQAIRVLELAGGGDIYGWSEGTNPSAVVANSSHEQSGHDFAVVDGRYLVDAWAKTVEVSSDRAVFDLNDAADRKEVRRLYGDPKTWVKASDPTFVRNEWKPGFPSQLQETDLLDTGEEQARLPGAESVRDQEIATPAEEAPFSLTAEVSQRKSKQTTLFQGEKVEPGAGLTPAEAIAALPRAEVRGIPDARVIPFPAVDDARALQIWKAADRTKTERKVVPIDRLVGTQRTFTESVARDYVEFASEELPDAIEFGGNYYLTGGHHRAIAAWAQGLKTIAVEVTPADPTKLEAPATEYNQALRPLTQEDLDDFETEMQDRHGDNLAVFDLREVRGDILLESVAISRGAQRNGLGTAVLEDLTKFADKRGARIILNLAEKGWQPTPAVTPTTSEGRLRSFYKRFGFVVNKGRYHDPTISAEMYREPTVAVRDLGQPLAASPTFYSKLDATLTQKMPASASAEQILNIAKQGIKREELEWSGLEDWLKEQPGQVTKADVLKFLDANRLELVETEKGGAHPSLADLSESIAEAERDLKAYLIGELAFSPVGLNDYILDAARSHLSDAQVRAARGNAGQWARIERLRTLYEQRSAIYAERENDGGIPLTETRYGQYTMPGGHNYRELLLQLPEATDLEVSIPEQYLEEDYGPDGNATVLYKGFSTGTNMSAYVMRWDHTGWAQSGRDFPTDRFGNGGRAWRATFQNQERNFETREAAIEWAKSAQREILERLAVSDERHARTYRTNHWTETNVVAHVRYKERETQTGQRVLFLEELQSDWHQLGRRHGYRSAENVAKLEQLALDYEAARKERNTLGEGWTAQHQAAADRMMAITEEMNKLHDVEREGVPDAPFKTTWPELAFKRMLRQAVEQGFDVLAWTPGEIQADRYDLSKVIDLIDYRKIGEPWGSIDPSHEPVWEVGVVDKEGFEVGLPEKVLNAKGLADTFGKDIADKIVAGQGEAGGGRMTLRGLDLRVGGEGMKAFYDRMLPSFANKYTKQWGGKVEEVRLGSDEFRGPLVEDSLKHQAAMGLRPVHGIKITPAMRAIVEEGQTLFSTTRRGSIRFGADRQMTIRLFEKADLSTFLHESGHFFLEVMTDLANKVVDTAPDARTEKQQQLLADMAAIEGWLVDEDHKGPGFSEKQHEQFARAFEAYLMEGRAPSLELRSAFARFRAWLISLYRTVRGLNVQLTDEVRGVFDRMLATDQAIAETQATQSLDAMFTTPESAGMTAGEFALYRQTVAEASLKAREQLEQKLLREVAGAQKAQYQERRDQIFLEVAKEHHARPVYQALYAMQRGTHPDGSPLSETLEVEPFKLSKDIIVDRYGFDRLRELPKPYIYSVEGGLDPDAVAQHFGFSSGDELLAAVTQAPPMKQSIEQETDRRTREQFGSILLDGTLHEEAQAALANDGREEIVRAEMRALANLRRTVRPFVQAERKTGAELLEHERKERAYERRWMEAEAKLRIAIAEGAKQAVIDDLRDEIRMLRLASKRGPATIAAAIPPAGVIRDAATTQIGRMRIREIKPAVFWSASRRAARAAIDAAAKQDFDAAIREKSRELLNLALYREAEKQLEDVTARIKRAKDLAKPAARSRLGLAGEAYLDQVDGILDRYEFATVSKKVLDRRASLRKFVAALEGEGLPVDLPEELLEETRRTNYQELTVEELVGVTDGLQQIVHLARLKNRLLKSARMRELQATAGALAESIRANKDKRAPEARDRRPSVERSRMIADFFAGHRKLASMLREMDGFTDGGPAWEAIMRPLNDAANKEAEMTAAATQQLAGIVERAFPGADKRLLYVKQLVPAVGRSLSKMERLMVALNWGNEGNRDRIRRAEGWNEGQVQAILDTLSEKDLQFVQETLDFVNSYWPQIEAKQKRVYGVAPEKVESTPIRAKAGEIKGGYFPLKYDDRLSAKAIGALDLEAANLAKQAAYAQATTKRGHTQARVARVKMPVRFDFGVIFEHTAQVIHDLTHHEALVDVGRILGHADVQQAILDTHGDLVYKQIRNTIRDVAFGDVPATNGFERAINHVRVGATVAGLGWNLGVALLQPIGLTNSMVRIGPTWVAKGVGRWIRNPFTMGETVRWIEERSDFMRSRGRTQSREISEVRNAIGVSTGRIGGWVDEALSKTTFDFVSRQGIADSYFWMIQQMQRVADVPTWLGQYEKSMAAGETEDRAVALADQAVLDSQGGGQTKDLAQLQRGGPMFKLWTNFYSYFNVLYNQAAETRRRTSFRHPAEVGRMASDYFMLFILPATLGFLVREALRPGGKKDEPPEDFWKRAALENVGYLAGTMLGLREVSGVLAGNFGYEGPAGARAFAALGRLGQQVRQGKNDEAFWRSLNDVAGVLLHYPASQAWKTSTGVAAIAEGKTSNPGAVVAGPERSAK